MPSFELFLESNGSKHYQNDAESAATAVTSWHDIRDWTPSLDSSREDLDKAVVERRNKLWKMVLASYQCSDHSAFTVAADSRLHLTLQRADRRTGAWGGEPFPSGEISCGVESSIYEPAALLQIPWKNINQYSPSPHLLFRKRDKKISIFISRAELR